MENQMNKAMPTGAKGTKEEGQARYMMADYMNADELRGALGSMMEMVYAQAGGMMMPSAGAAMPSAGAMPQAAPSGQQANAGNEVNRATTQATAATAPGNAEVLFEACTMVKPMNQSLRKAHSMGTYYFLAGKNNANG